MKNGQEELHVYDSNEKENCNQMGATFNVELEVGDEVTTLSVQPVFVGSNQEGIGAGFSGRLLFKTD